MHLICVAVASFAVLAQPAVAQGTNTKVLHAYPGQVLQGNDSQTCHSGGQRERMRNEVDTATLSLLQESIVPLLQNFSCGRSTGWRRVAYLDMSDPSQQCPSVWQEITTPFRVCGRKSRSSASCEGLLYTTRSVRYNQVCGRIIGYQRGPSSAFHHSSGQSINSVYYVEGVSVTRGSPRKHIWTFAAGINEQASYTSQLCPCVAGSTGGSRVPSFVGQNYFCETGRTSGYQSGVLYPDGDPLWDGHGCGLTSSCCTFNSPPWFKIRLPSPTTDYIEVRICSAAGTTYEDTPIQLMELYVK